VAAAFKGPVHEKEHKARQDHSSPFDQKETVRIRFCRIESVRTDENSTTARAITDFSASLESLRPSTRRLYLAGAKALLRAAFPEPTGPRGVAPYEEL
jgi:hypothetical protein